LVDRDDVGVRGEIRTRELQSDHRPRDAELRAGRGEPEVPRRSAFRTAAARFAMLASAVPGVVILRSRVELVATARGEEGKSEVRKALHRNAHQQEECQLAADPLRALSRDHRELPDMVAPELGD